MTKEKFNKGEIVIYRTPQNEVELMVKLKKETVWLSLDQMAVLFNRDKSVISRHIRNIFEEKELNKNSVVAKFATTAADGKIYKVDYYGLDIIISVGYRVKSKNGVKFRIWASKIIKQYLIKGYTINEKRLLQARNQLKELQGAIGFLQEKAKHELLTGQEQEIFNLLAGYSKTLTLLEQYDKGKLGLVKKTKGRFVIKYNEVKDIIGKIKRELVARKEAEELFGQETAGGLKAILGNIYQSFNKKELYLSLEEKAAHLLYFIIKDHPFVDGNKRIASFLFIYFLDKNNHLYRFSGEKKINDNALTALSLLIAISDPKDKDALIRIITNLLSG